MIRRIPKNIFDAIFLVGHDEDFFDVVPAKPTHHAPGSLEKLEVMRKRVTRGESLWHPDDAAVVATLEQSKAMQSHLAKTLYKNRKKRW
jgi:hypothetical protein